MIPETYYLKLSRKTLSGSSSAGEPACEARCQPYARLARPNTSLKMVIWPCCLHLMWDEMDRYNCPLKMVLTPLT